MDKIFRFLFVFLLVCPGLMGHAQEPATLAGTEGKPVVPPAVRQPDPILMQRSQPGLPRLDRKEGRIRLDVMVNDAEGKPVTGLDPWDFKILDGDQPRKVLSFHSYDSARGKPDPPVEVILLIDMLNLRFQQVAFVRTQVERFLKQNGGHLAAPVRLLLLSESGLRIQPRPSVDGNALVSVLDQIKGHISALNPAMGSEGALERFQMSVRQISGIATNEAKMSGRKLLIWVGPGWPMLEGSNFNFTEKDRERYFDGIVELSTRLREARLTVYSVAPDDSSMGAASMRPLLYQNYLKGVPAWRQADSGNLALKVLVTQTGGRILGPDNDLATQISECMAEAATFYTLTFDPLPAAHVNEYRDLRVEVSRPGVIVRTYTGYYNQPPAAPAAP